MKKTLLILFATALMAFGQTSNSLQYPFPGTAANSHNGDPLRIAFMKINNSLGLLGNDIDLLHPPVQLAGGWVFDSQAATVGTTVSETVTFFAHQTNIFQLLSTYTNVHIDTNRFIITGTNVIEDVYFLWHTNFLGNTNTFWQTNYVYTLVSFDVAQTNLVDGWLVEQLTNGSPLWTPFTNYTTVTNSGELTFTNLVPQSGTNLPVRSFRIRGPFTFGPATFTVPVAGPSFSVTNPPDLVVLSNEIVGWVQGQQYVSALQTNVVLSSSRIPIYTTNTFVFSGSNYVGRFAQLYNWTITTPPMDAGWMIPPTNQYEAVWCSYSGTNGWFLATNGFVAFTNISVAIVGEAGGYGSVTLFGLDHPEIYGRTNSFDGQSWLVNGSPIASQADIAATVHVLATPVQLAGNWIFDSQAPTTTNETVSFTTVNAPIFQLLASSSGVHIDNFYLICTATNTWYTNYNWYTNFIFGEAGIDVAQTNLLSGWLLEQCTNLAPPIVWAAASYTSVTNSGERTLIVPHDANIPAAFFRIRVLGTTSATFSVPVTLLSGTLYPSNAWDLGAITNGIPNFSFWTGSSNGQAQVTLYLSNGVSYIKRNFP